MKRKASIPLLMMFLTVTILTVSVSANENTIYIMENGSVNPSSANITSVDNVIYTFTDNNYYPIVVLRDNIVIDGASYTLTGTGSEAGIDLSDRYNVTIKNLNVEKFYFGILLDDCSGIIISGNNITANTCAGIVLSDASENDINRNNIVENNYGIYLCHSSGNHIFPNNFVNNIKQVYSCRKSANFWDAGYPRGGNYWSNYEGVDSYRGVNQDILGIDGIGDQPYHINMRKRCNDYDHYPLMGPFGPHIMLGSNVAVFPNSEFGLIFDEVTSTGSTKAMVTTVVPPPPPDSVLIGLYYDVKVTATFSGGVLIRMVYDDSELTPEQEANLRLEQTDIIPGDINLDGKVTWKDIYTIIRALGSHPEHRKWNPICDLNKDQKVNIEDFRIARRNYGKKSQWIDITTYVDVESNIIYGITSDFSIFGVRSRI